MDTKKVKFSKDALEGMVHLAKTDPGMEDLLARALEYYILMGEPAGPVIFRERLMTKEESYHKMMNTRYGL